MKHNTQADVWRLLRRNLSLGQTLGYAVANVVGLSVVLVGILFFADSQHNSDTADSYFSSDYAVLSKRVTGIGFTPTAFSQADVDELAAQPWARKVGRFTSSQFAVNGSVVMGGKALSTYLFFESVPDDFFDVKPRGWSFEPGDSFVPIILCKDYLTLYNFGFAIPQGLPQLSEDIVGAVPIRLRLTGDGMQPELFEARIVGFSSRLNTIAVPQSFMDWANARFAPGKEEPASRLIVEVDRMAAGDMEAYLAERDIEQAGDNADAGNIASFLATVSAVVAVGGVVICLLAMFILVLSIFLLLQKSKDKLQSLMLLGYEPRRVARHYELFVVGVNAVVALLSVVITFWARTLWTDSLVAIGLGRASALPMLAFALVYLLGVTALDVAIVRRRLLSIWRSGAGR